MSGSVPFQTTLNLHFLACRLRAGGAKKITLIIIIIIIITIIIIIIIIRIGIIMTTDTD